MDLRKILLILYYTVIGTIQCRAPKPCNNTSLTVVIVILYTTLSRYSENTFVYLMHARAILYHCVLLYVRHIVKKVIFFDVRFGKQFHSGLEHVFYYIETEIRLHYAPRNVIKQSTPSRL